MPKFKFVEFCFSHGYAVLQVDGKDGYVLLEEVFVKDGAIDWKSKEPANALWMDVKAHKDNDLDNDARNHIRFFLPFTSWRKKEGCEQVVSELLARGFTENDLRFGIPTIEERELGIAHLDDEGRAIQPYLLPENFALEGNNEKI